MAARAIMFSYREIQPTGAPGVFSLVADVWFIDDDNTHPTTAAIVVPFAFTETGGQIQNKVINAIIELGQSLSPPMTIAAASNQIFLPSLNKV